MKKSLWMLCITLLLNVLLIGCNTAAVSETSEAQNQPSLVDTVPAPADSTPVPADSTPVPEDSVPAQADSVPAPAENAPAQADSPSDPANEDGFSVLVNVTRIALGMRFSDVIEGLGGQTAPDQELGSCDGDPDSVRTTHFYPGLTVTENKEGVICGIEVSSVFGGENDAVLKGKVRLGTTLEETLAALGEPENKSSAEDDCVLIYRQDGQEIYVFLTSNGKQTVSGISLTLP